MELSFVVKRILLFLAAALLVAVAGLSLLIDVYWLHNEIKEISVTEILQGVILASMVCLFIGQAVADKSRAFGSVLISGFFACMLIRELDFAFDGLAHGSWVWFALAVALLSILYCLREPAKTAAQLADFMRHQAYGMMVSGLLCILVFSRIFGMSVLWQELMADGYDRVVKNMAEEGTELFGYMLCLMSSVWYMFSRPDTGYDGRK